jgi:hypothetical protein
VLHLEWLDIIVGPSSLVSSPVQASLLLEHDVAQHESTSRHRVVEEERLGSGLIAHKHHGCASVNDLGESLAAVLHMCNIPERAEKMNRGIDIMPYLVGGLPVHTLRWSSVQEKHGSVHRLPPQISPVVTWPSSCFWPSPSLSGSSSRPRAFC